MLQGSDREVATTTEVASGFPNHCTSCSAERNCLSDMAKHPRKKQRTAKSLEDTSGIPDVQPLGSEKSLLGSSAKDDEERRLESMLFGTAYGSASGKEEEVIAASDEEEDIDQAGEKELQNMLDTDVSTGAP